MKSIIIHTSQKFSPISLPAIIGEFLSVNFVSCVNNDIDNIMVTFTALAKIYPNISAIQRYMYLCLAKFLSSENFWLYVISVSPLTHPHNYTYLPN